MCKTYFPGNCCKEEKEALPYLWKFLIRLFKTVFTEEGNKNLFDVFIYF